MRLNLKTGLVALAVAAGCGQVGGSVPVTQTAQKIATTVCPKAWTCCTAEQLSNNSAAGTSEADCETETESSFQNQLTTVQGSVDQKRATYQQAQVDACLATIQASTCDALDVTNHLAGVPGCASFTSPLVAVGGACSQNYECIDGWCNTASSGGGGDGVCAAFVAFGQSCTAAGGPSCGPNAVCDIEGTPNDASDDLCEPVSGVGGPCTDDLQCTTLACSSSGGSGMTCQAAASPAPAMCFYASGCSAAGGPPGAVALVVLGLAGLLVARRRRSPRASIRARA